jgi:hypothetical protein
LEILSGHPAIWFSLLKNGYRSNIIKFYCVLEIATAYRSFVKNGNFNLTRAPQLATVETCPSTSGAPLQKRGRTKLLDDNFAASLDVAKLGNRKAAVVLTTTLKRLGFDPLK